MNKNIILKNIHHIFKYLNIFDHMKRIEPKVTATCQTEDCAQNIKQLSVTFHIANQDKYFKKTPSFIVFTIIIEFGVQQIVFFP